MTRKINKMAISAITLALIAGFSDNAQASPLVFTPGDLVVSRSVYTGTAGTVTVGQPLPGGGNAVANGTYPNVFQNEGPDASFGVTSPIYLDDVTTSGTRVNTFALPTTVAVTSFPSKSELGLNLSADGKSFTFMGYAAPANALDISNTNTPGVIEPGNPVTATPTYREVVQVDAYGNVQATTTNAYAGNNGRNAIAANGQYYTVGNAGNGNGSPATTAAGGVQIVTPGQNATPSTPGTTKVGNYNITQNGYKADKTAKDNNFRGETIFNNTLYVTKGSGGNGINTVYQVGNAGSLPTLANAASAPITILPGFSTTLAKATTGVYHPFGLFFADPNTLYVADEGDGTAANVTSDTNSGLEKWSLVGGTWTQDYTLKSGLALGQQYSVGGYTAATDGLRNLTGHVNSDGTVTLYAVTSTISNATDQGADPNKLVAITDTLAATSLNPLESFTTLQSAGYGEVIRGVTFAPAVPEPAQIATLGLGLLGLGGLMLRARRKPAKQA